MDYQNMFPKYDKVQVEAVRQYVTQLSPRELKAVFMRFWGPCSIEEIASELRVSWDLADEILNRAMKKLRISCVRDSAFAVPPQKALAA